MRRSKRSRRIVASARGPEVAGPVSRMSSRWWIGVASWQLRYHPSSVGAALFFFPARVKIDFSRSPDRGPCVADVPAWPGSLAAGENELERGVAEVAGTRRGRVLPARPRPPGDSGYTREPMKPRATIHGPKTAAANSHGPPQGALGWPPRPLSGALYAHAQRFSFHSRCRRSGRGFVQHLPIRNPAHRRRLRSQ